MKNNELFLILSGQKKDYEEQIAVLQAKINPIQEKLNAVLLLMKDHEPEPEKTTQRPSVNNSTKKTIRAYRTKKRVKTGGETVPSMVKKALEAIGQGKTSAIAEKMIELYQEYGSNPEKATLDARYYISHMKRNGLIEVVEEGKGNEGSVYKCK